MSTDLNKPSTTHAAIESACAELVFFQQESFRHIGSIARPFLCVESEFVSELKSHMRMQFPVVSDGDLAEMADAVMVLARLGGGNATRH